MDCTGILINYYIVCSRKCWLFVNNFHQEHSSDLVKIGKYYHEEFARKNQMQSELEFDSFKIDKIQGDYVVEYKKKNSDEKACEFQLLFYLYKLKQKGINKKGILKFKESKSDKEVILTSKKEKELLEVIKEIEKLVQRPLPPRPVKTRKCYKCAYYYFCFT